MAKKKYNFKKFISSSLFLIVFGLFFMLSFSFWRYYNARILSFNTKNIENLSDTKEGVVPVYLKAYPVGVDVDIKKASIINGVWVIHPMSASYLINSSKINGGGNIVIYGHNKNEVIGPIRWIKKGAEITVLGEDNNEYQYKVVKTDTVDPDNLFYLQSTSEETLTVYTCTGILDSKRFIVVAKRTN
jgi:LPXTG-site transpeptidase (sortase) family protein